MNPKRKLIAVKDWLLKPQPDETPAFTRANAPILAIIGCAVLANVGLWTSTHTTFPLWPNIPPAPSKDFAGMAGLGDNEFAYRTLAFQLQRMGNEGGVYMPLYRYDYNRLGQWLNTLHALDYQSNYVPYLAAYYFGATQDPRRQLGPVIDYLATAGRVPLLRKWRWMSQAVFQAYYKKEDKDLGLRLAYEMAALPGDMPQWARKMPAILSAEMGDKETALRLMRSILIDLVNDPSKRPDPTEVNFTIDFICKRLQTPLEAKSDPVCNLTEDVTPQPLTNVEPAFNLSR